MIEPTIQLTIQLTIQRPAMHRQDWVAVFAVGVVAIVVLSVSSCAVGHEGFWHPRGHHHGKHGGTADGPAAKEAEDYFRLFTTLIARWPLSCREELISQAAREHEFFHGDPHALDEETLRTRRRGVLDQLTALIPMYRVSFDAGGGTLISGKKPLTACRKLPSFVLIQCTNSTAETMVVRGAIDLAKQRVEPTEIPPNRTVLFAATVELKEAGPAVSDTHLKIECRSGQATHVLPLPIRWVEPARLRLRLTTDDLPASSSPASDLPAPNSSPAVRDVAGRITVQCSDGVCRSAGPYGGRSTFTDKPIIYPPIGTWQKLSFFYVDQPVEIDVPPGPTRLTFERGFEHHRQCVNISLTAGQTARVERSCERIANMSARGWVSGDTHVHWVTNAWNVDEPLQLLHMVQQAEDLKVANNLTLLQRYASQAFVKPSQAPMGPIAAYSDARFHMQMGEEYRNEDLYGHLCFLNIDWLVQPIGTGSIIAGPDSLDYPINRTAIEACRVQGGISIEAHGTGGNKDVPVNVIHHLSDSLDQMEPEMYYRLLDCGFRLP